MKQNERETESVFCNMLQLGCGLAIIALLGELVESTRAEEKSQATVVACSSIIFSAILIIPVTGERPEHPKPMRGKEQFWAAPS